MKVKSYLLCRTSIRVVFLLVSTLRRNTHDVTVFQYVLGNFHHKIRQIETLHSNFHTYKIFVLC